MKTTAVATRRWVILTTVILLAGLTLWLALTGAGGSLPQGVDFEWPVF